MCRSKGCKGISTSHRVSIQFCCPAGDPSGSVASIRDDIKKRCVLSDWGLKLRNLPSRKGFSLESDRIILDDETAKAASEAAAETGLPFTPLYTYLANSIRAGQREIPYSVITAADLWKGAMTSIPKDAGPSAQPSRETNGDAIWLTDWAAQNLRVSIGDSVEVDYYLWQEAGQLTTSTARFRFAGTIPLAGEINASLAPEIPGVTEARSISSWDPPFPLELNRIRSEDEDFWNRYKATPKAFISLAQGQRLWHNRFGNLTAVRMALPDGINLDSARERFSHRLESPLGSGKVRLFSCRRARTRIGRLPRIDQFRRVFCLFQLLSHRSGASSILHIL